MYALLLLLFAFPLPGRGDVPVEAHREAGVLIVEAGPGHFDNVVIEIHGDPDAVAVPLDDDGSRWSVSTDRGLGTFTATQCGDGACWPVYEVFQTEDYAAPRWMPLLKLVPAAMLVGLLMNFMPCVLPVLGLKLLCFTKGGKRTAYVAGVLTSFAVLAGLSAAFGAGLSHMSVPVFRIVLSVVCFLVALKLFDVWHLPNTGFVGHFANEAGPFGSGVLTVALGSSCSVPFLAPVLVYLASCPVLDTFVLFMAVGVGFVSPFLLPLQPILKKFGPYVRKFEIGCGVAMMAVSAWIMSTLNPAGLGDALLLTGVLAFVCIGFSRMWAWPWPLIAPVVLVLVGARAYVGSEGYTNNFPVVEIKEGPRVIIVGASWCVNCSTVEPIWDTPEVLEALTDQGMEVEHWDWSNGDPGVTVLLNEYDHVAVPFVLVIRPDGSRSSLKGMYTQDQVLDAIYGTFTQ